MKQNFSFCFLFILLLIHCIKGARIKSSQDEDVKDQSTGPPNDVRPQYITQFSDSLRFLSSFFQVIQRQLNESITNFNPNRPNLIFSALLKNPTLIPFALKRFREPISDMITITNKIENIMSTSDPNQLNNDNDLNRHLQQLQLRLQSFFGPLVPHNNLMTRTPVDIPSALMSFSNWVSQMASMLAIFSQSVRDITTGQSIQKPSLDNKSEIFTQDKVDSICSQLRQMSQNINFRTDSQDLTEKQLVPNLQGPSLSESLFNAITNLFDQVLSNISVLLGNLPLGLGQSLVQPNKVSHNKELTTT
jgi:hypothetical protein